MEILTHPSRISNLAISRLKITTEDQKLESAVVKAVKQLVMVMVSQLKVQRWHLFITVFNVIYLLDSGSQKLTNNIGEKQPNNDLLILTSTVDSHSLATNDNVKYVEPETANEMCTFVAEDHASVSSTAKIADKLHK